MSLDEFSFNAENGSNRERMRRKNYDYDTQVFKSKNLEVERRRREKLSTRILLLRSLVPIITMQQPLELHLMNKATIVEDAITYIETQQNIVQSLSYELHEMEATSEEIKPKKEEIDAAEEMNKLGIVQATKIDGNKLWVKMIIEKKRGRFKKLMEAMDNIGIELIDTNVTTLKKSYMVTTFMQVTLGKIGICIIIEGE
ncbi:Transcription factor DYSFUNCTIONAL TAPETUM 1 [Glycine soja]|uniref:Transcription factor DYSFUNCTIONAL TAPETUM 1 n=1 Tax=Glycine soja TaxID=3848 RepID=A0A0B2PJ10_GLYSO|nr:Transcription factor DYSFUNCTIONAL TAPETUM 1 [Glycine soja]